MALTPNEGLLTTVEAAKYLQVSWRTMQDMRRKGVGPTPVILGYRTIRYRREDLDAWAEGMKASAVKKAENDTEG